MTFDDDSVRIHFTGGTRLYTCREIGLQWPPPKAIDFMGFKFKRVSMSEITDEQRKEMTHVFRGAEYEPV